MRKKRDQHKLDPTIERFVIALAQAAARRDHEALQMEKAGLPAPEKEPYRRLKPYKEPRVLLHIRDENGELIPVPIAPVSKWQLEVNALVDEYQNGKMGAEEFMKRVYAVDP